MKTWEIYHYIYGDICDDSWYGKDCKHITLGFVVDTEDNVRLLVDKINSNRRSYYAKDEPEDELDRNYEDEDYISYKELETTTLDAIERRYIR